MTRTRQLKRLGPVHGPVQALVLAMFAGLVLAGCESAGFSAREAEIERQQGKRGFAVLERGEKRALFAAKGREVAVEPPKGYCLDEESIAVSRRSAFVLVADCMGEQQAALANGESGDRLPRAFPGILTVTVSGEAAFGEEPGALPAFEALLDTRAGGRLLGRGDGSAPGEIVTMRRVNGALYVLIEEAQAQGGDSILAPRFWRAFTEVSGRLVLVTVSGFNDRPMGEGEMLAFLAAQIAELRKANGQPGSADETEIAAAVMGPDGTAGASPLPVSRRVASSMASVASPAENPAGSGGAPVLAPMAPRRPG